MIEEKDILKKNILFRGLTDDEIDRMIKYLNGKIVQIPKGNILKNEGDMMENICVVLSGDIYAQRVDENGVNCIIQFFNPGDSFGEMNAIGGYPMNVSLMAKDDSSVLCLSAGSLFRHEEHVSPFAAKVFHNLSLVLARKAYYMSDKLMDRIHRTTRQRIQDYLSEQYHINEQREFTIPLDRQDLADYLFVDRSAMSKELGKMKEEGLISFDKADFKLMISMPITDKKPEPEENSGK